MRSRRARRSRDKFYTWEQWGRTKAASGEKAANDEQAAALKSGKILVKDAIADIALQQVLTRPDEFDVIATTNLNGDYLSDALAAQVGGIGIAPGANINYVTGHAVFEATHGTAPKYADLDKVNPGSVILSGEMMLRYLGWTEAADAIISAMDKTIAPEDRHLRLRAPHGRREGSEVLGVRRRADPQHVRWCREGFRVSRLCPLDFIRHSNRRTRFEPVVAFVASTELAARFWRLHRRHRRIRRQERFEPGVAASRAIRTRVE